MPATARHRNLVANVVEFCRLLRARDLLVTPSEALDAVRALGAIEVGRREHFYHALRTVLTSGPEDVEPFDEAFAAFWTETRIAETLPGAPDPSNDGQQHSQPPSQRIELAPAEVSDDDESEDEQEAGLYSPAEMLTRKDFGSLSAEELREVTRVAQRIARRLATRLSRRMRAASRGPLVDARRTMRRSLRFGGTALELVRRRRRILRPKLVLICDVSRSMETYSRFLLLFAYTLQQTRARVETFVFSTQLTRITPFLRGSWDDVVRTLGASVEHWAGGTRIGQSLQAFNERYAPALVGSRTVVIILSDGLDTGDVDVLDDALRVLKRRAARLVWLNPYLGRTSYQPLARGMSTALPHLDVFAPAHNLAALRDLERYVLRGNGG